MILVTTEKPSVAKTIAQFLGASAARNGYYEGNGYLVVYALGHLISLAEPEHYGEQYKRGGFEKKLLPIIPEHFDTVVKEDTKTQYEVFASLLKRNDVEYIIDAGDPDPQGQYLQWLIRQQAGCHKKIRRLFINSYDEKELKRGFSNLIDGPDYNNIIAGEFCKAKLDWIMGMSYSRWYSAPVGRVKTPTLNFVVERFLENRDFKPEPYYQVRVEFKEGFSGIVSEEAGSGEEDKTDTIKALKAKRFSKKEEADAAVRSIESSGSGIIMKYETKHKKTKPPKLYFIDELEKDGINYLGMTAADVLAAAQSLYEKHKITTYPRAESPYIIESQAADISANLSALINRLPQYQCLCGQAFDNFEEKRIINPEGIEAHHAIIVTENVKTFDFSRLSKNESEVFHLIVSRMFEALSQPYEYDETIIVTKAGNYTVVTKDSIASKMGFKAVHNLLFGKSKEEKEVMLSTALREGQQVLINNTELLSKMTTAPELHTESTLLSAMLNASNSIKDNAEEKEILKDIGIGTKSDRAAIIASLYKDGYITSKGSGKKKYLIPTERGMQLINSVEPELKSASVTAAIQGRLKNMAEDKLTEKECMEYVVSFIQGIFERLRAENKEVHIDSLSRSTEAAAVCPNCGGAVLEGKFGLYCSKKCGLAISKVYFGGRELNQNQIIRILGNKKVLVKGLKSKAGKEYDAYAQLDGVEDYQYQTKDGRRAAGKRLKLKMEFPAGKR